MAHADELRQAYTLMKEDKKREAGEIVQNVLEQDRKNTNAWWMLANLLDDEQRIRTCLQQVLKLDPMHKGANAMLKQLNAVASDEPVSDLFAQAEADLHQGSKATNLNVVALDDDINGRKSQDNNLLTYLIGAIIFIVALIVFSTLILPNTSLGIPNGNPAQQVQSYFGAFARQDFRVLRQLTCEADRAAIDDIERIMNEAQSLRDQSLDMSGLGYREIERGDATATVRVSGQFVLTNSFGTIPMDYDNLNAFFGGLSLSSEIVLVDEDGRWRVCPTL